ncbi:hypothetical protein KIW84_062805 [Lathyrus oleraceus]|uniref:Uncharacterized protein n=1 Tax=Pisum sativum TaxID=3888 RepID=A0A9D4W7B4_PEA|nr:hypothetical protein KIW84_062805 [Pisum sativum]
MAERNAGRNDEALAAAMQAMAQAFQNPPNADENVKEGKTLAQNAKSIDPSVKPPIVPKEKISQATLASKIEVQHQTSQPSFDSLKAFTGSIIEHGENLEKSFKRTKFNFTGFRFSTFKAILHKTAEPAETEQVKGKCING